MYIKQTFVSRLILLAALGIVPAAAQADTIFNVTMDTTSLQGKSFGLFFQLNDGDQTGDSNNTATISDFAFGGGTAGDCAMFPQLCVPDGGASGNITTILSLIDSSPYNSFLQQITPGSSLSFKVDLTTNVDGGVTPDVFTFNILDAITNQPLPTGDPNGTDTLLTVTIDSVNPEIKSYGSSPGSAFAFDAPQTLVTPPTPTPPLSNAPEPDSLVLIGIGLLGLILNCHQRLKKRVIGTPTAA
jgi:hypothetical protein